MKKRIFVYIVIIQLIIIGGLVLRIYKKDNQVLGVTSVNPIKSEDITISSSSGGLKNFYEPKAGISFDDLSWIGKGFNYKIKYSVNQDTLNQMNDIPLEKENNTFRIVTLGDSFTFGVHVMTENNYPSQLQKELNSYCGGKTKFEVLNLGVSGYDIQYAVNRYRIRGQKYNPDMVIWLLIGDDFLRLDEALVPKNEKYSEEMHKTGEFQQLLSQGNMHPSWERAENEIIKETGGIDEVLQKQEQYLGELSNYFKKSLVLVSPPGLPLNYNNVLSNVAGKRRYTYIDNTIKFYMLDTFPDKHPTEKGYETITENIFNYLKSSELIPCSTK